MDKETLDFYKGLVSRTNPMKEYNQNVFEVKRQIGRAIIIIAFTIALAFFGYMSQTILCEISLLGLAVYCFMAKIDKFPIYETDAYMNLTYKRYMQQSVKSNTPYSFNICITSFGTDRVNKVREFLEGLEQYDVTYDNDSGLLMFDYKI